MYLQSGGPKWSVLLGRLDSKTANFKSAENLPSPFDNLTVLQQKFTAVGLHTVDLVALSGIYGAHQSHIDHSLHAVDRPIHQPSNLTLLSAMPAQHNNKCMQGLTHLAGCSASS